METTKLHKEFNDDDGELGGESNNCVESAVKHKKKASIPDYSVRITNLGPTFTTNDAQQLIKPFGPVKKIYVARDKTTGACKGFAFIRFKNQKDAESAITKLNGYEYNNCLLNVDWSERAS